MTRTFSWIATAFAAAALAATPIAAQAKTRAGDSGTMYTQSSFSGTPYGGTALGEGLVIGALEHDDEEGGIFPRYLLAILAGALVFTAFFTIDGGTDQSAGT